MAGSLSMITWGEALGGRISHRLRTSFHQAERAPSMSFSMLWNGCLASTASAHAPEWQHVRRVSRDTGIAILVCAQSEHVEEIYRWLTSMQQVAAMDKSTGCNPRSRARSLGVSISWDLVRGQCTGNPRCFAHLERWPLSSTSRLACRLSQPLFPAAVLRVKS